MSPSTIARNFPLAAVTPVARAAPRPAVSLVADQLQGGVRGSELTDQLTRAICRAVVHNDDLVRAQPLLRLDRADAFADHGALVIRDDDEADVDRRARFVKAHLRLFTKFVLVARFLS